MQAQFEQNPLPKISVIIPFYNVRAYVYRCLNSIMRNTYKNLEIICIDDGSSDDTLKLLEEFAKKDSRILVINQKNCGVSSARNRGIAVATGEYIAFIDADDWVHKSYFEILLKGAVENNADIVICSHTRVGCGYALGDEPVADGDFVRLSYSYIHPPLELRSFVWGRLYKRCLVEDRKFPIELSFMEDKLFALSILSDYKTLRVYKSPQMLYYYFNRDDSACSKIKQAQKIEALSFILNCSKDYESFESRAYCLDEVTRYLIRIKNGLTFKIGFRKELAEARKVLRQCFLEMKENYLFSKNYYITLRISYYFPIMYNFIDFLRIKLRRIKSGKLRWGTHN